MAQKEFSCIANAWQTTRKSKTLMQTNLTTTRVHDGMDLSFTEWTMAKFAEHDVILTAHLHMLLLRDLPVQLCTSSLAER